MKLLEVLQNKNLINLKMRLKIKIVLISGIFSLILVFSCKRDTKHNEEVLVEAYGEKFTKEDLVKILPLHLSEQDSAEYVNLIIQNWLIERVLFNEAKSKLADTTSIHKKVEEYRKKLYVHSYQEEVLFKNLNTKVTEAEIEEYYNKHLNDYVLNNTYVKAFYLTMNASVSSYYEVLQTVSKSSLKDEKKLKEYCIGAEREVFFVKEWIELNELFGLINYSGNFSHTDLVFNNVLDFISGDKRYIVKFDEYVLRGQIMPLEIARPIIYKNIIKKRKESELKRITDELIKNAQKSGEINIYYDSEN